MSSDKNRHGRKTPAYSTSPLLAQLDCVEHGFFGSAGGVSEGLYRSLNCGFSSHDLPGQVRENRRRVAACFGLDAERLHSLKQVHSDCVVELDERSGSQFEREADGMVTATPGVGLGPLGADCAPVLFVDPQNRVIGAAHSGWKGALTGINEAVIQRMQVLGAQLDNIHAAIGPAMQPQYYEVQRDFRSMFEQHSSIDSQAFFIQRAERLYFDTPGYIQARLRHTGLEKIDISREDTFSQPASYFSYRRSSKAGDSDYGRQVGVIVLKG